MTSAPVTAPTVNREARRRVAVARTFYYAHSSTMQGHPTDDDYAQADGFLSALAERGDAAYTEATTGDHVLGFGKLLRSAVQRGDRAYRQDMLRLHDWDELVFGGFICLACTPDDAVTADDNVGFPCPPLREAGVTEEMAVELIVAHYAEQDRRVREAIKAGLAVLPKFDGFRDFDGVAVGYVGDHGDMVALGWHANYREVLHAFDCLARADAGINGVYDDPDRAPGKHDLTRTWAINTGAGTAQDQWCLTWGAETTSDTEGAFPITLLAM